MYVAGSIGPLPSQPQYEATVEEMIVEQAAGIDRRAGPISFSSRRSPIGPALERCAAAMRQLPEVPFVLSFAIVDHRRDGLRRVGRRGCWPRLPAGIARSRSPGA